MRRGMVGTNELHWVKAASNKIRNAGRQNVHGEHSQARVSSENMSSQHGVSLHSNSDRSSRDIPKGKKGASLKLIEKLVPLKEGKVLSTDLSSG